MGDLKEQVKKAIIEAVNCDLERYFDYEIYQEDVDRYYFRYDGAKRFDDEIESEINGNYVLINVGWGDATLNDRFEFTLSDVEADLHQYDEDDKETITGFSYKEIRG